MKPFRPGFSREQASVPDSSSFLLGDSEGLGPTTSFLLGYFRKEVDDKEEGAPSSQGKCHGCQDCTLSWLCHSPAQAGPGYLQSHFGLNFPRGEVDKCGLSKQTRPC